MYSLKNEVEELKFSIDKIKNNELKTKELGKYEKIIRSIESAVGIEQILNENIKKTQNSKWKKENIMLKYFLIIIPF